MFALTARDVDAFVNRAEVRAKLAEIMRGEPAGLAAESDDRTFERFDVDA